MKKWKKNQKGILGAPSGRQLSWYARPEEISRAFGNLLEGFTRYFRALYWLGALLGLIAIFIASMPPLWR